MYDYAAGSGLLGESAQGNYEMQASGKYGLLVGGRSEILVSGRAIFDSPFLGHGSWAKDDKYSSLLMELRRQAGYIGGAGDEEDLIPTHSHLFGSWVEAGLSGAIFWAWVLGLPVLFLFRPHREVECLAPISAFVAFLLIWDILFSPYGAGLRIMTPYYVVFMMTCLGGYRRTFTTEVGS
jgi:O-antigen ligase